MLVLCLTYIPFLLLLFRFFFVCLRFGVVRLMVLVVAKFGLMFIMSWRVKELVFHS